MNVEVGMFSSLRERGEEKTRKKWTHKKYLNAKRSFVFVN